MVDFIKKIIESEGELNNEERNIVSASYKNVVGNKRAEMRVLTAIE
jgi:14-3-3 protein epsilon